MAQNIQKLLNILLGKKSVHNSGYVEVKSRPGAADQVQKSGTQKSRESAVKSADSAKTKNVQTAARMQESSDTAVNPESVNVENAESIAAETAVSGATENLQPVSEIISEKKEKRMKFKLHQEPKIIIRDKHTTFAFLTGISKVIIGVFKAFVAMVACCFVVSLVFLVALFVISICLTKYSVLFIGIDISLVAISVINVLILLVMINYIINKKTNFVIILYVFLGSLVFLGCGLGIGCVGLSQFKFLNSMDGIEGKTILKKKEINVEDNLIIRTDDIDGYSIKIDNSMSDRTIKVVGSNDENYFIDVNVWHEKEYGMSIYYIHNSTSLRFNTIIEMIYNDLENKIFRNYYISDGDLEVVCNSKVAEMLINNAKKTYLVDVLKTDNGYRIGQFNQKIYLDYSCEMEYDARSGKYSFDDRCLCTKEERMSPNGNLIDFDCKNISSDERI